MSSSCCLGFKGCFLTDGYRIYTGIDRRRILLLVVLSLLLFYLISEYKAYELLLVKDFSCFSFCICSLFLVDEDLVDYYLMQRVGRVEVNHANHVSTTGLTFTLINVISAVLPWVTSKKKWADYANRASS